MLMRVTFLPGRHRCASATRRYVPLFGTSLVRLRATQHVRHVCCYLPAHWRSRCRPCRMNEVVSIVSRGSPKEICVSTAEKGNGNGRAGMNGKRAAHRIESLQRPVVVCGGAGFLGSHLCARLLNEG